MHAHARTNAHSHTHTHTHSHTHTLINLKNVISLLRKWQFIGGFYYSQFISTPQGNALRMLRPAPPVRPPRATPLVEVAVTVGSLLRPAKVDAANKQRVRETKGGRERGQTDRQWDSETSKHVRQCKYKNKIKININIGCKVAKAAQPSSSSDHRANSTRTELQLLLLPRPPAGDTKRCPERGWDWKSVKSSPLLTAVAIAPVLYPLPAHCHPLILFCRLFFVAVDAFVCTVALLALCSLARSLAKSYDK